MELWLNTNQVELIEQVSRIGILTGITTTPQMLANPNISAEKSLSLVMKKQDGPVGVQLTKGNVESMVDEAEQLNAFSSRIIMQVPVTAVGLEVIHALHHRNIPVMATAIYAPHQALLAFKAGADYVVPFLGAIQDNRQDSYEILELIQGMKNRYSFQGKILASDVRNIDNVIQCTKIGVNGIAIPEVVMKEMLLSHSECLSSVS